MFWGLILESCKFYTQDVEYPLYISQAALDTNTGDGGPCQVILSVDDQKYLICTLQKHRHTQATVDQCFRPGETVTFLNNGKCNIHLTGYMDTEYNEEEEMVEGDEQFEELPRKVKKRKATFQISKQIKKPKTSSSAPEVDIDENGTDTSGEGDSDDEEDTQEDEEDTQEDEEESQEDEEDSQDDEDTQEDSKFRLVKSKVRLSLPNSTLDTPEPKSDETVLSKSQKRRLKKKLSKQNGTPQVNDTPQVNGTGETSKAKKTAKPIIQPKPNQQVEKKKISGGVLIEDIKVGSGAVSCVGKEIVIYYEGRLKSNNKVFDKCQTGPGFKFKLGAKEVIDGFDVGLAGMKVGGTRRIICPPKMAYGAKGSAPVIPPNSTLVFDVTLKNVK